MAALLVDPSHHGVLLALVQGWPNSLYQPAALIDAIAQRMRRPGGETRELWQALAHLYRTQGRPDLSLAILLQLQLPTVFDFIQVQTLEGSRRGFLGCSFGASFYVLQHTKMNYQPTNQTNKQTNQTNAPRP
jgi:hypothetical protein